MTTESNKTLTKSFFQLFLSKFSSGILSRLVRVFLQPYGDVDMYNERLICVRTYGNGQTV